MKYDDVRPVPYRAVRVWLSDGSRVLGMWTGEKWWSINGEISPVSWELQERVKKTKKLEKALRESEEDHVEEGKPSGPN
jgi:hypothetical protein